ncbi:MAG: DUF3261 domain-containing protein [Myxococcales bacterium]|nr:DUF3261 domain-containing protein [Myxococcales bacterium]
MRSALALALLLAGCCPPATTTRAARPRPEPALRPVGDLPYDFFWRQRVTARWGDGRSQTFDAVLQKHRGTLRLVGLSPLGVGFVIELRADGTTHFQNRTGRRLPFAPSYMLADVQRAFYPWPSDRVQERHKDGHLVERTFRGKAHITYHDWRPGNDAARRVVVHHLRYGYVLVIETTEQKRLP